jgi:ssDNA-binding replication factor A large subunit
MRNLFLVNKNMDIKQLSGQHGIPELTAKVVDLEDSRNTRIGLVESWKIKDSTGDCTLTLFKEQVGTVSAGDNIKIENGWCTIYQDKIQVSTGKFGVLRAENPE